MKKKWLFVLALFVLASCKKDDTSSIVKYDIRVENASGFNWSDSYISNDGRAEYGNMLAGTISGYKHIEDVVYTDGRLGVTWAHIGVTFNSKLYQTSATPPQEGTYTCKVTYSAADDRISVEWIK